jgi:hypothetical protein
VKPREQTTDAQESGIDGASSRNGAERVKSLLVKGLLGVGLAAWVTAVAVGMGAVWRHADLPGKAGPAPAEWPGGGAVERSSDRPTLVVFFHPKCPCSQASAAELERLLAHAPGRFSVTAVFVVPDGEAAGWEQGPLWDRVGAIPEVKRVVDMSGQIAGRFGAETSGYALVYDIHGERRFAGGITSARGHEGDNAGRSAIEDIGLRGGAAAGGRTPVFGCALGNGPSGGGA